MIKGFEPRLYQQTILHTASKKNTLVVLPTGLGKTNIAVLLAANRLGLYPGSKVLILAPTKPLCDQHAESLKEHLEIASDEVCVFTGMIKPEKREGLWRKARVIVSTPQGLENDLISGRLSMKDVSLLVLDEAHRAVGDYSYVFITKIYEKNSDYSRILGLTASPGSDTEKIREVCRNLFIEEIELRNSEDPDVKPYVQEVNVEWVKLDLPQDFMRVREHLRKCYESKLEQVRQYGFLFGSVASYSKSSLLEMQRALFAKSVAGDKSFELLKSISLLAEALKVQHAIELVETQDVRPLIDYMEKLEEESQSTKVKAVQNLVRDLNFRTALIKARQLVAEGREHPKISALRKIVSDEINSNKGVKIIIFNQYRDSSSKIRQALEEAGVKAKVFFGQANKRGKGLSQKEQKKLIEGFRNAEFNCLVATSVAEEGLDIPQVDIVIFYEPVPSAIRSVQRRGRTGRQEKGRVIVLITNQTRDEANLWAGQYKEKRMHKILADLKNTGFSLPREAFEKKIRGEAQEKLLFSDDKSGEGISIHADYREKASGIIRDLSSRGVRVELSNLEVGDYVLSERVVVEFKKVVDFVDSIIDGRLLAQLSSLKKYDRPLILIEGEEDIYSVRKIHPNAIRGAVAMIIVNYGIPLFQTKNSKETADILLSIAKREALTGRKEYSLHSAKPLTEKEIQEYIISSFPGIGSAIAKPILKYFRTIKDFVNASEEEMRKVELIGEKKAGKIKEIIDKKYGG